VERKQDRAWFDVLGISPAALVEVLKAGPPEPLLNLRLLQKQACGERVNKKNHRQKS